MGIGKRNGEGYYDPTAYEWIKLAELEQEKESVKLVYKNGRMELYIYEFFPCTAAVARRVFPLIRRFAQKEDKEKLKQYLQIKSQEHFGKVAVFTEKADSLPEQSEGWHFYRTKAREEQMRYNQAVKNLAFLESGGKRR